MALTILSMATVIFLHFRNLYISDVQNYILIKLCKTSGSIYLFKIKGTLNPGDIKLNRHYLWDTLEINWIEIKLTLNGNKIDLSKNER